MSSKRKSWVFRQKPGFGLMLLLLVGLLSLFLGGVFLPGTILFSNDGPLARLVMECHRLPQRFSGSWDDLYSIGYSEGAATPTISSGLLWLLGPVGFSKFYAPVALLILGVGAWCFLRQAGLTPAACLLGAIATSLNSGLFTAACWGVAAHPIVVGLAFFAMAALQDTRSGNRWLRLSLGGLAVGMAVAEGADIGALFSLVVAAFLAYQTLTQPGPTLKKVSIGALRIALVSIFAAWLAAECVFQVVVTDVEGVMSGTPEAQTAQGRWDWTTQWSLPKVETLSLVVPGLFGYRLDSPNGGCYWGAIGRTAEWDRYFEGNEEGPKPTSLIRFTGGSCYAGVPVVLIALWAFGESLRRKDSAFELSRRKWIWFWAGLGLISLLLAYGRFAPFYQLIYHLPFFSTMRNPTKFLHIVAMSLVILFSYGVDGLWRRYLAGPVGAGRERIRVSGRYERWWIYGMALTLMICLGGWLGYANSRNALQDYLHRMGFRDFLAEQVAGFSIAQVGWFILFFVLSGTWLALVLRRFFTGGRWAAIGLGLILVADLWHANQPWVIYWDYPAKYASNPVIDLLRERPYESRVTLLPAVPPPELRDLMRVYRIEWMQQTMPYYNIQAFEISQLPRRPTDLVTYDQAFESTEENESVRRFGRQVELTNTRYIFGLAGYLDLLNDRIDPELRRIRIAARFDIVPKPGFARAQRAEEMTVALNPNGPYALFEHPGVLPRARLYSHWQVETNDPAVLQMLSSPSFQPSQTVLVNSPIPNLVAGDATHSDSGRVEITHYTSRKVDLKADAASRSILLLNDRYAPGWQVWVDGRPEALLRCNYIMRGVLLSAGHHEISFQFHPKVRYLYSSVSAVAVALVLLACLGVVTLRQPRTPERAEPSSVPVPSSPKSQRQIKAAPGQGRNRNSKKSSQTSR
jgi:hypothetical protein